MDTLPENSKLQFNFGDDKINKEMGVQFTDKNQAKVYFNFELTDEFEDLPPTMKIKKFEAFFLYICRLKSTFKD